MSKVIAEVEAKAAIIPVALARPIYVVPSTLPLFKDNPPVYVWVDPFNAELHVVAEELTIHPAPARSFVPCGECPDCKACVLGEPTAPGAPACHKIVMLQLGQAIFVGPQLLGAFRQTGEWNDLPDKLWDVLEDLAYREMQVTGNRDRWMLTPPVEVPGGTIC